VSLANSRSTIGLKRSTKAKLDRSRAPGQCYDGFLCQLVDMWEGVQNESYFHARSDVNPSHHSDRL
jgi:hypothetical protein